MKIIDIINGEKPSLSFEVFPPKTSDKFDTVEKAATILCNVKAMGGKKWRVTKEQVMTLYENYGIDVDGTFFD